MALRRGPLAGSCDLLCQNTTHHRRSGVTRSKVLPGSCDSPPQEVVGTGACRVAPSLVLIHSPTRRDASNAARREAGSVGPSRRSAVRDLEIVVPVHVVVGQLALSY